MNHPGCLQARMEFIRRTQGESESFEDFAEALTDLSIPCHYGMMRAMMLRDVFVINLHPKHREIQKTLMSDPNDITLGEALVLAKMTTFTVSVINPVYKTTPKVEIPSQKFSSRRGSSEPPRSSVQQRLLRYRSGDSPSPRPSANQSMTEVLQLRSILKKPSRAVDGSGDAADFQIQNESYPGALHVQWPDDL